MRSLNFSRKESNSESDYSGSSTLRDSGNNSVCGVEGIGIRGRGEGSSNQVSVHYGIDKDVVTLDSISTVKLRGDGRGNRVKDIRFDKDLCPKARVNSRSRDVFIIVIVDMTSTEAERR